MRNLRKKSKFYLGNILLNLKITTWRSRENVHILGIGVELTFRRNISPPSSGWKNKKTLNKHDVGSKQLCPV
jgi:hypothetical protein